MALIAIISLVIMTKANGQNTIKYVNVTSGHDKSGKPKISGTISTNDNGYYKTVKSVLVDGNKITFVTKDNKTMVGFSTESHILEMARFLAKNLNTEQLPPPPDFSPIELSEPLPLMGRNCIRMGKKSDKVNVPLTAQQRTEIENRIKNLMTGFYIPSYQFMKQTKIFRDIQNDFGFNAPGIEGRQLSAIVNSTISRNNLQYRNPPQK